MPYNQSTKMDQKYIHNQPFVFESNQSLNNIEIAYSTFGQLNKDRDNVIWVFHAISANSDVMSWWPGLFGDKDMYKPEDYFIICANAIGSPFGSSMPANLEFPSFTIRDVVKAHLLLAEHLGIQRIHTAIGGSFGGYQALEFAYSYPHEIDHLILLASSARESAWGIAIHESQRIALKADPSFGEAGGGQVGMKTARSIAMLTYRTSEGLIKDQTDTDSKLDNFKASSYINYHGDKFVKSFNALSYYYLTKCIDSHNIGRDRGGEIKALQSITIPTLVIGFNSDTLVPVRFQKFLAEHIPKSIFQEFDSKYGHDGFLKETEKIKDSIQKFYRNISIENSEAKRTILKFGGTSLYGQKNLNKVIEIVSEASQHNPLALVVSARGKTTDKLIKLYSLAKDGLDFSPEFEAFKIYQQQDIIDVDLSQELKELATTLKAIQWLKANENEFAYDWVLSFGEIISAKCITHLLQAHGIQTKFLDARKLIFTELILDEFKVNIDKSRSATQETFQKLPHNITPVITGFIASSEKGRTVTLGRNGSNYSATLIASFILAKEVQNWTDVQGIFSSNPSIVPDAIQIEKMTYREANEMANFGVNLLHPKTIVPLMQSKIPLVIKSTREPSKPGTTINYDGGKKGIKAVTMVDNVALVAIEGNGLSGKVGIDARIFTSLHKKNISVKMISQASSERGIGFVISEDNIKDTELLLNKEFKEELTKQYISSIRINKDVGIIAIIGRHNYALEKAISILRKNKIWMHLISNSISGEHISLVVDKGSLKQAARLVHAEVFASKKTE